MYNLIGWDRATDTFTGGQWLKKSVYAMDSRLSPDGRHFIYSVHDANPDTRATNHYTVLSRVPWFTALALFPHGAGQRSGGYFLDNTLYRINCDTAFEDIMGQNTQVRRVVQEDVTKTCRSGLRLLNGQPAPLSRALRDQLLGGAQPPPETAMDRYETQAGRLYRRNGIELELIRDFAEMEPRFEAAPYSVASGEEVEPGWHPTDHEGSG
jgi:hypothetical protein